jgi:hypothetical protein
VAALGLLGARGESGGAVISTGADLTVALEVTAETRLPAGWELGIAIATPLGTVLGGTNTRLLGARTPALSGTQRFSFQLKDLRLGDGEYIVQTSLSTPEGTEVHALPDAVHFTVEADGRSQGAVYLDASFATD